MNIRKILVLLLFVSPLFSCDASPASAAMAGEGAAGPGGASPSAAAATVRAEVIAETGAVCAGSRAVDPWPVWLFNVDPQIDFMEGGPLAVADSGSSYLKQYDAEQLLVRPRFGGRILTRDWHPADHTSFAKTHDAEPFSTKEIVLPSGRKYAQTIWPVHCVQDTRGADFAITVHRRDVVWSKGTGTTEAYSAFFDEDGNDSGLVAFLRERGVRVLLVGGVATDYCVLNNVLHALRAGFRVVVNTDWIRGVDPASSAAAIERMRAAGALFTTSAELGIAVTE